MAKKDKNGRLVVPKEIIQSCSLLSDSLFDGKNFVYFINSSGEVGVGVTLKLLPFPEDFKFLSNCDYDRASGMLTIPENVDLALGDGEDYYFATSFQGREYLYIYKHQTNIEKLLAILSNVEKNLEGFQHYLNEDIDE